MAPSYVRLVGGLVVLAAAAGGCDSGEFAFPDLEGVDGGRGHAVVKQPAVVDGEIERGVVPGIAGEPDLRIRLRDATTVVKLGVSLGDQVWVMPQDGLKTVTAMTMPVDVALDAGWWTLTDKSGSVVKFLRGTEIDVAPEREMLVGAVKPNELPTAGKLAREATTAGLAPKITVDGGKFGGKVRLSPRTDVSVRSFDVIESVGVEEYLKGVVTAEMWPNWPLTAFQVQAVCARTYALHQRQQARSQSLPFDVESSVKDQAYKGAVESVNGAKSVRDTEGVVLTWNGQVLRAYYSSCSGGRAASARDTWPTGFGYEYNLAGPIQATVNPEREAGEWGKSSPYYRWETARTRQEMVARLKAWGANNGHPVKSITGLNGIVLAGTNVVGRPTQFDVLGAGGVTYTLSAEQMRVACNAEAAGTPKITKETRVYSGDAEFALAGDVITIKGRGFGHGVGMDQYAVKEMADKGLAWKEIVMKWYPGAKVEKAY